MILQLICPVHHIKRVTQDIFVLSIVAPEVARSVRPGQFLNIRIDDGLSPLLRRPFSVHRVEEDRVEILFDVVGKGTGILSRRRPGDSVDILGPLGTPFSTDANNFSTALLVAGGLGVAPLPLTTEFLLRSGKSVVTMLGARTSTLLVDAHLRNVSAATDDGTKGFEGTVVDLLKTTMGRQEYPSPKIFGCGPMPMLRTLSAFSEERGIPAEVSLEGPMACGIGICQGCPVELRGEQKSYGLMCKDGPVFDVRKIVI